MKLDLTRVGNYNWNINCVNDGKIRIAVVVEAPEEVIQSVPIFDFTHFGESVNHRLAQGFLEMQRDLMTRDTVIIASNNVALISNDILRPDCYFIYSDGEFIPFHLLTNKELKLAHNIEKMYRAGAFEVNRDGRECPKCGKPLGDLDISSGIRCSDPKCDYWFCF